MISYSSLIFLINALRETGTVEADEDSNSFGTHNAIATLFATFIYNAEFFSAHGKKLFFCCSRQSAKVKAE